MPENFENESRFEKQGGKNVVAGAFFELYKPFGKKYGYNETTIPEAKLLAVIEKAGITDEEINTLVNAEIGELTAQGLKKDIDQVLSEHPRLIVIRDKFVKAWDGAELIEA